MRVRARSVFEGKRKCPGFRNVCDIRFSLRVDVFAFAQQPNGRHAPLLFLPLARETLRKEENQVYRVSTVLYTCIGKMKSYIVFLGKLNFCLEMEKQLRLFEIG